MPNNALGQGGVQASSYGEMEEHAVVDGVAAKKVFPITLNPLAQTNASYVIYKNATGYTVKIEQIIGATTYTTNIVPYDGDTTSTQSKTISVWT